MPSSRRIRTFGVIAAAAALSLGACLTLENGLAVLTQVSGNNQTIPIGSTTHSPLVVRALDRSNSPMEGVAVGWSVTSGGGSVSSAATTTDASGFASVTYTPGTTPGPVEVKVTAEGLSLPFNLTVVAATGGT